MDNVWIFVVYIVYVYEFICKTRIHQEWRVYFVARQGVVKVGYYSNSIKNLPRTHLDKHSCTMASANVLPPIQFKGRGSDASNREKDDAVSLGRRILDRSKQQLLARREPAGETSKDIDTSRCGWGNIFAFKFR